MFNVLYYYSSVQIKFTYMFLKMCNILNTDHVNHDCNNTACLDYSEKKGFCRPLVVILL